MTQQATTTIQQAANGGQVATQRKPVDILKSMMNAESVHIIRKSKFPQNPKRSVRFSGKGTKRSVQKKESAQHSKSRNKRFVITSVSAL